MKGSSKLSIIFDSKSAQTAMREARKLEFTDIEGARRLYLLAAKIFVKLSNDITEPNLQAAILYFSKTAIRNAQRLSLDDQNSDVKGEIIDGGSRSTSNLTEFHDGRVSLANSRSRISEIDKIPRADVSNPLDAIHDMLDLESRLFEMGLPSNPSNSHIAVSRTRGSNSSRLDESYLFLSTFHCPFPDQSISPTTPYTHIKGTHSRIVPSSGPKPHPGPYGSRPLPDERRNSWTLPWTTPGLTPSRPPTVVKSNKHTIPGGRSLDDSVLPDNRLCESSLLIDHNNECSHSPHGTSQGVRSRSRTAVQTEMSSSESRLLLSIQRLSEENAHLIRRLDAVADAQDVQRRVRQQMETFKTEYKIRFAKIRKLLPSQDPATAVPVIPEPTVVRLQKTDVVSGPGNKSVGEGGSQIAAGGVGGTGDDRVQQLERTVRGLLSRLEKAKVEVKAKDERLRKLEKLINGGGPSPLLNVGPSRDRGTLSAAPPPPAPMLLRTAPAPHRHPSTATLETALHRPSSKLTSAPNRPQKTSVLTR